MSRMPFALMFILFVAVANPARAQEPDTNDPLPLAVSTIGDPITFPSAGQIVSRPQLPRGLSTSGSSGMRALYVTTVLTQGLDVHSTLRAVRAGTAVEANPLMAGLTRHPAALIATKAAVTACTILSARKLAKSHRRAAMVTLIAINATYSVVAVHNYRVARGR